MNNLTKRLRKNTFPKYYMLVTSTEKNCGKAKLINWNTGY